jgi:hypothetical protein
LFRLKMTLARVFCAGAAVYRVVVFKAAEDEFKGKARENRLTVRDFNYSDGQVTRCLSIHH